VIEDAALAEAAVRLLPAQIDGASWGVWTEAVKAETGAKGRGLFRPLRLAVTGAETGPEMAAILPLIGRETIERRLLGEIA
jgi:glutamyl-tRNA synthetase